MRRSPSEPTHAPGDDVSPGEVTRLLVDYGAGEAAGRKSNEVIAGLEGVVWIRSYISQTEGKIYCEYDAPSEEAILEHARLAGLPADRISEISLEVSPTMFV